MRRDSGLAEVVIAGDGRSSELGWTANVNGPLGSLAKPLLEGYARKIADQIFDPVKSKVG